MFVCRARGMPQGTAHCVHRGTYPWHIRTTDSVWAPREDTALQLWGCRGAWGLSQELGSWSPFLQEVWRISFDKLRRYGRRSEDFATPDMMRKKCTGSSLALCKCKSLVCMREELGSLCLLSWELETPTIMKAGSLWLVAADRWFLSYRSVITASFSTLVTGRGEGLALCVREKREWMKLCSTMGLSQLIDYGSQLVNKAKWAEQHCSGYLLQTTN